MQTTHAIPPDPQRGGAGYPTFGSNPSSVVNELKSLRRVLVVALVLVALYMGKGVLIRLTLATLLSFVLSPLVDGLRRLGLWRAPAIVMSVLLSVGVIGLVGVLVGSQAAMVAADAPRYAATLEQKFQRTQGALIDRFSRLTAPFRSHRGAPAPSQTSAAERSSGTEMPQDSTRRVTPTGADASSSSPLAIAERVVTPFLAPLETTVIVFVVSVFVLAQRDDLRDRFIRMLGPSDIHRTTVAMDEVGRRLSRYFLSQLCVNAAFGSVISAGLWAIGIPSPALWGILAGLLRFVPYIGAFLAVLPPLALGAAVAPGWAMAVYVGMLFAAAEPLTAYAVEPILYGHSTGLSPLSVIVAATFWTWMWGPIGLILSTPLTLCLVVMGRHIKSLEVFDVMLGDRPALSPVEAFYQRVLGNNPHATFDTASAMLATLSLTDYYDNVVVGGLRLAAEDEARGVISHERAAEITSAMLAVIDDLEERVEGDAVPSGITSPAKVAVCLAGRGPFDDVMTAMCTQLLRQRGVNVRRLPYAAASRSAVDTLDVSDVSVFMVLHLNIERSTGHVRVLLRRLRKRAPDAKYVVGLWSSTEDLQEADADLLESAVVDTCVTSIREACDCVSAILMQDQSAQPSRTVQVPAFGKSIPALSPTPSL